MKEFCNHLYFWSTFLYFTLLVKGIFVAFAAGVVYKIKSKMLMSKFISY